MQSQEADERLNFMVAGAQKAGTTTLDVLLRRHPQIAMATAAGQRPGTRQPVKETHFFDNESRDWSSPDYADLHAYYGAGDDRLWGESTPVTLYWKPAISRIRAYNPAMRMIVLLRNPIERAFSHWQMDYRNGGEMLSFSQAIREGRERLATKAEKGGLHRTFSYVERGLYAEQLSYLTQYFPREQIHCEISEEFFANHGPTLQRIAAFLGVRGFPGRIPFTFAHQGTRGGPEMSPADDDHLRAVFRDDIARTEAFLGRTIDAWTR